MTRVKMKAPNVPGTNLHLSAVGPDPIGPGEEFEINETEAAQLEKRGLATRVGGGKKADAPANKMADAPANKTISAASTPAAAKRKGK